MEGERTAATAGIAASLATAGVVAAPYLLLPSDQLEAVARYYAAGAVTPLGPGLLGLIGAIVFAAGRQRRSDPDLVAGVVVAIGLFSLVAGLEWAFAFRPDLVASTAALEFMDAHRWSVPAAALLEAAAALWYAAARGLLAVPGRPRS